MSVTPSKHKGTHIVIEGQDATGKSTQAKMLADYLRAQGQNVIHYSEAGTDSDDPFVAKIAELTYGSKQNIDHCTRVMLYLINRYEQWRKLAVPTLENGGTVITTRSWLSTLIYEGYNGGVSRELISRLHRAVMPSCYFSPDHVVILTLSDQAHAKRLADQGARQLEFWKSKPDTFQKKINQTYFDIAKEFNIPTLDAFGSIEEVQRNLRKMFGL